MSHDVDELFEGAGAPTPRTTLVWVLLGVGLVITAVGMACTAAPGGIVVLLAWYVVEKEVDRIESGYLPPTARIPVRRARLFTLIGVILVITALIAQTVLTGVNAYGDLWAWMLTRVGLGPAPPPAL